MAVCVSCAPPAPNFPPHNDGDHYGGTGSCSVCGPDVCHAFTAAPEPEHDPRPIDAQFKEVRAALDQIGPALGARDESIRVAHGIADKATARLDVIEADHRALAERLAQLEKSAAPPA